MAIRNKAGVVIMILLFIIGVLGLFLVYLFVIRPQITGYAINNQIQGYQIAINDILTQIQQTGFVQIPIGNQTLILAPVQTQQPQQ